MLQRLYIELAISCSSYELPNLKVILANVSFQQPIVVSFNGTKSMEVYEVVAKDSISENKVKEVETKMIGFPFYTSSLSIFCSINKLQKMI